MTRVALLLAFLALVACGIDGEPSKPGGGVSVSGDVRVGVVGSL
ncbi:MAG: argininosuccinate lyase [Pseudomonadota bacterium]